jgi:hypothetical protein
MGSSWVRAQRAVDVGVAAAPEHGLDDAVDAPAMPGASQAVPVVAGGVEGLALRRARRVEPVDEEGGDALRAVAGHGDPWLVDTCWVRSPASPLARPATYSSALTVRGGSPRSAE